MKHVSNYDHVFSRRKMGGAKKVREIVSTMNVGDTILVEPDDCFYHMARTRFWREGKSQGMQFTTAKTDDGILVKRLA